MNRLCGLVFVVVIGGFGLVGEAWAQGQAQAEWPCFHGPRRDNVSTETGLLRTWPEGGPKLLWTAGRLGKGYSSVSIAGGTIFTAGMANRQTFVVALGLDGKVKWHQPNGRSWKATMAHAMSYDGARSTPTVDGNTVYHLSDAGRLGAFATADGKELWAMDVLKEFGAEMPKYGLAESVLIDGEKLLCCPGGSKGYLVCLDKRTGKTLWTNTEIAGTVGYSSLVPAALVGRRQYVGLSASAVFGVEAGTGKLLWSVEHRNMRENNATDPVPYNACVYAASGYGKGSILVRLTNAGDGVETTKLWSGSVLDSLHGGVVRAGEHLYGSGHNDRKWSCVEFMTGKVAWSAPGKGSLTCADGMLYCLDEKGKMTLVEARPEKYTLAGSFTVPSGGSGLHWAHPVVCGGRLYVRHDDKLFAYDVRK